MRVNPKYIQLFGDALIPLLGYFWWDWNLYFIVLFYLLDYCASEIFTHVKSKKIISYQELMPKLWIKYGLLSFVLLISGIFLIHLAFLSIQPGIDFWKEFIAFVRYKDIGFEQGYILLPLIILVGFQRYKLEFVLPRKYVSLTLEGFWKEHLKSHYLIMAGVTFVIGFSTFVVFSEMVYIFGIVVINGLYQYLKK